MQLVNKIFKQEFVKNVFTLVTGTSISQLIPFLVTPLLTRIFYAEDFGVLALYMSLLMLFSVISTGRYEMAIMLPESDKEACNLSVLSIIISFLFSLFLLFLILCFYNKIIFLFPNYKFGIWLYFIPLSVFLISVHRVFIFCLNRDKKYKKITFNRVIKTFSSSSFQVFFGLLHINKIGLVLGEIIGQFFSVIILVKFYFLRFKDNFLNVSKQNILLVAKKYNHFPFYNGTHAMLDMIQINFIIFLITIFYNSTTLGFYALAIKVIRAPITLIGSSISNVLYQKLNKDYLDSKALSSFVIRLIIILFFISIPFFVLIYIYSVPVFSFLFGSEWVVSGKITSLLVPWILINFLSNPISIIPNIIQKQKQFFILSFACNITALLVFVFCHYLKQDFYFSIQMYSYIMGVNCLVVIFWIIYILRLVDRK